MKRVTAGILVLAMSSNAFAQVRNPIPPNASVHTCNDGDYVAATIRIDYSYPFARPNGQNGEFFLWYSLPTILEQNVGNVNWKARYNSNDVDVQELFRDMGVWVMASNTPTEQWSRTRWEGECYQQNSYPWTKYIRPTDIYGRLMQLEPPLPPVPTNDDEYNNYCGYKVYIPGENDYCGHDTNGGGDGEPGDSPPSQGGDLQWLCDYKNLPQGCYDVYVDGQYADTICCP